MRYLELLKTFWWSVRGALIGGTADLQPRDVLEKLFGELEKRKKFGIEEKAYVPNRYMVYLSPCDYEEISPLLSGIREQLHNKLMDRIRKKGYKLLTASLLLDIRGDSGLLKGQVVVESSFLKEKNAADASQAEGTDGRKAKAAEASGDNAPARRVSQAACPTQRIVSAAYPSRDADGPVAGTGEHRPCVPTVASTAVSSAVPSARQTVVRPAAGTRIIEDGKTRLVETGRVRLEIVKEDGPGDIIVLKEGEYTFGRGRDAQYLLEDAEETVSRLHFQLIVRDSRIRIKDLNSLNGTRVNDIAVEEAELQKGDLIAAGKILLKVG